MNEIPNALQGVINITEDRALELDITYVCNMGCVQCNRVLGIFPSQEFMESEEIGQILKECLSLPEPFKQIRILGGEPTLHPHLSEILDLIDAYRTEVDGCTVSLWSHGYGKHVQDKLRHLPDWLEIKVSPKLPVIGGEGFEAFLAAPVDFEQLHDKDYANGCSLIGPGRTGVGVSIKGIYSCPVAGAIDRVLDSGLGLQSMSEISTEAFKAQCEALCRYCGHFLVDRGVPIHPDTISPTWEALRNNQARRKGKSGRKT